MEEEEEEEGEEEEERGIGRIRLYRLQGKGSHQQASTLVRKREGREGERERGGEGGREGWREGRYTCTHVNFFIVSEIV